PGGAALAAPGLGAEAGHGRGGRREVRRGRRSDEDRAEGARESPGLAGIELERFLPERHAGLLAELVELVEIPLADERDRDAGLPRASGASGAVPAVGRIL